MNFLKRLLGICQTNPPQNAECWQYADGKIMIDLSLLPEISAVGTAVRLEGDRLPERVLLVHGTDGKYHAYLNKCTHMNRRIDPLSDRPGVECCSVSKTTYDYDGKLLSGPGKGPLKAYPVDIEDGKIVISLS